MQLNLQGTTGSLNPVNPSNGSGSGSGPNPPEAGKIPYLSYEKKIVAHAFFAGFGFLILLPIGALVARWLRMVLPSRWFRMHAVIQFWICEYLHYIISRYSLSSSWSVHYNWICTRCFGCDDTWNGAFQYSS